MDMIRVCVDAVGGDEPAEVVLEGIAAALEVDECLEVLVAGPEQVVVPFCRIHERAEPLIAPDIITMEDDPVSAVMTKRKSSIVLGCRAVKKGMAAGFFSAGSTGAITAAGAAYVTPFKMKVDGRQVPIRPCLTNALPNQIGGLTVLCDMGANPDVEHQDIVRFAQMGRAYASCVLGLDDPRIGLLANGTEEHKGSTFTRACYPLMVECVPGFVGNCEGSDLTSGRIDVAVCDGFSGNIALKSIEGAAKFMMAELKSGLAGSLTAKAGALLISPVLRRLKTKLSGDAKGGAVLLGLRGVVLIGHGATSVEAVKNGTLATADAVRLGLIERVAQSMGDVV